MEESLDLTYQPKEIEVQVVVDSVVVEEVDSVVEEVEAEEDLVVEEVEAEVEAEEDLEVEEVVDVEVAAVAIDELSLLIRVESLWFLVTLRRRSSTERHKVLPLKSWYLSLFCECPDNVPVSQLAHPILCLPTCDPHFPRNYC